VARGGPTDGSAGSVNYIAVRKMLGTWLNEMLDTGSHGEIPPLAGSSSDLAFETITRKGLCRAWRSPVSNPPDVKA